MGLQIRPPAHEQQIITPLKAVKKAITQEPPQCTAIEVHSLPTTTDEAMREKQLADPFANNMISYMEDLTDPQDCTLFLSINMLQNDVLYHMVKERGQKRRTPDDAGPSANDQLVLP